MENELRRIVVVVEGVWKDGAELYEYVELTPEDWSEIVAVLPDRLIEKMESVINHLSLLDRSEA